MKRVLKYQVPIRDEFTIEMPTSSVVLSTQVQHDVPCVWVLVNAEDTQFALRTFLLVGTGEVVNNLGKFIGTFQINNSFEVYHLFEKDFS